MQEILLIVGKRRQGLLRVNREYKPVPSGESPTQTAERRRHWLKSDYLYAELTETAIALGRLGDIVAGLEGMKIEMGTGIVWFVDEEGELTHFVDVEWNGVGRPNVYPNKDTFDAGRELVSLSQIEEKLAG